MQPSFSAHQERTDASPLPPTPVTSAGAPATRQLPPKVFEGGASLSVNERGSALLFIPPEQARGGDHGSHLCALSLVTQERCLILKRACAAE